MIVLEPWQWAVAVLGAFLIGVSKTGIGGLGLFATALFALIMPARESVGVVLLILLSADVIAIVVYRRDAHWGYLLRLFPWAAAGVAIGAVATGLLPSGLMRVSIGAIVILLVGLQALRTWRPPASPDAGPPRWLSPTAGLSAGVTTMVANAAGPLMTIYLLAMRLPTITFVGTAAWFFFAINLFKLPFSYSLGLITPASALLSLRLAPVAVAGALSGRRLIRGMDQQRFNAITLGLTLLAGVRLLLG